MDILKLEGIASAIDEESLRPSPSHNNLARLLSLFVRELIATYSAPVTTVTTSSQCAEVTLSKPVKTQRRKPK